MISTVVIILFACAVLGALGGMFRCRCPRSGQRGFTVAELLIVTAILGVFLALAIYGFQRFNHGYHDGPYRGQVQGCNC